MTSSKQLQNAYVNLYRELRNYIWGFDTVQAIANLEIEVYSAFPDVSKIQSSFNTLCIDIRSVVDEDEDLAEAVESFKDMLSACSDDKFYVKLAQVQEVL